MQQGAEILNEFYSLMEKNSLTLPRLALIFLVLFFILLIATREALSWYLKTSAIRNDVKSLQEELKSLKVELKSLRENNRDIQKLADPSFSLTSDEAKTRQSEDKKNKESLLFKNKERKPDSFPLN